MRTQLFGQIDVGAQSSALVGIELLALRRLDHHRSERPMVGLRHIRSGPDGFHVARIVRYVHQHVLAGLHARARLGAFGLARQPIGHAAQRDLAQRRQVLPGEEVAERRAGAIGKVYLSCLQALDQIVWLDIDELEDVYKRQVQARVNEILGAGGSDGGPGEADIDALARAVIRGEYGNGEERKSRLGSLYDAVQARVNEILL